MSKYQFPNLGLPKFFLVRPGERKVEPRLIRANRYRQVAFRVNPKEDLYKSNSIDGTLHFRNRTRADYPENQWPKEWGYNHRQDLKELEEARQKAVRRARYNEVRDSMPRKPVKRITLASATREQVIDALHKALSKEQDSGLDGKGRKR